MSQNFVSGPSSLCEKAALSQTASTQNDLLSTTTQCAYVHVPFCPSICSYCAFCRTASLGQVDAWLKQIEQEIVQGLQDLQQNPAFCLKTLYFGGGTPSLLSTQQLGRLAAPFLGFLNRKEESPRKEKTQAEERSKAPIASWKEPYEWTVEINPETVGLEDLRQMRQLGINRLSIGVQSFDDASLARMNRHHTAAQAIECIAMARQAGFRDLSMDLIYALPWTTLEDVQRDLDLFLQLDLPHLSIYSLQIEEDSVFGRQHLQPVDEDVEADMYEMICARLKEAGYVHYEISSFAKPGWYSLHNLAYWSDALYAGFGCGACGRDEKGYYANTTSLKTYLEQGPCPQYDPDLKEDFTALMMGLRTCFGIRLDLWQERYQRSTSWLEPLLQKYPEALLLEGPVLRVTEKGMEILNTLLVEILEWF